jgi:hypothetical protein
VASTADFAVTAAAAPTAFAFAAAAPRGLQRRNIDLELGTVGRVVSDRHGGALDKPADFISA